MATRHRVKPGDSVIRLAEEHGFFPETIWDHPDNAKLKEQRTDMNVLLDGDIVVIPDREEKIEPCASAKRHRFRRKGMPAEYRLQVFRNERHYRGKPFRMDISPGGLTHTGVTDPDGVLSVPIPADARRGRLWLGNDPQPYDVAFGYLDPEDAVVGIRQRLEQLGYDCMGDSGEDIGIGTTMALMAFQDRWGLALTGEADGATIAKLEDVYSTVNEFPEPQS